MISPVVTFLVFQQEVHESVFESKHRYLLQSKYHKTGIKATSEAT